MQMFADTIGVPMEVTEGTQLGALGAAMAAAVSVGEYRDFPEAIENMTSIGRRFEPNATQSLVYQQKYLKYKELIGRLI